MILKTNKKNGFSTLEILVAFSIFTLMIGGITLVSFGNQTNALDTELAHTALLKAKWGLSTTSNALWENANSFSTTSEIFSQTVTVTDISECVKYASSTVTWNTSPLRPQKTELFTILTSTSSALALGGDCQTNEPLEWSNVIKATYIGHGGGNGADTITSLDTKDGKMVMTGKSNAAGKNDLFIYDIVYTGDPTDPATLNDFSITNYNGIHGLNGVDIGHNSLHNKDYAYIANNYSVGQLQIIDYSTTTSVFGFETLPNITSGYNCPPIPNTTCATAKSIYFYNDKIYIGTPFLFGGTPPLENNELHIYDVTDPTNPSHTDSIDVDRNVNSIKVRDGLAFLAIGSGTVSPYTPLKIYDVDPVSPNYLNEIGSVTSTNPDQGSSVYVLGNYAYLGKKGGNGPNFQIINISNPSNPHIVSSLSVPNSNETDINEIFVTGGLAFLAGGNGMYVYDVRNPNIPVLRSSPPFTAQPIQNGATSMDYDGKYMFVSAVNTGNGLMAILCSANQNDDCE